GLFALRDAADEIGHRLVGLARLGREARHDGAEVAFGERRRLVDLAGEKPLAERAERHETDAELLERGQDLALRLAIPKRVLALQRGHGLHGVSAPNRLRAGLGQAEMLHFAGANELLHGAGYVLDGHGRIHAVLIVEIDRVDVESLQRGVGDALDALGLAVEREPLLTAARVDGETELRCDRNLAAKRRERFADELFVRERTVNLGRVEERHALLDRRADQRDGLALVRRGTIAEAQAHAAEPDRRGLEAGVAEFASLHGCSPSRTATVVRAGHFGP